MSGVVVAVALTKKNYMIKHLGSATKGQLLLYTMQMDKARQGGVIILASKRNELLEGVCVCVHTKSEGSPFTKGRGTRKGRRDGWMGSGKKMKD
mgnify:CR=1 FL=1